MKHLLSYRTKRLLHIVELLITSGQAQNIETVQAVNHCSLQTAYSDIKYLTESKYNDILKIRVVNKHIYSEIRSMEYLMSFKQSLYQEEGSIQLLMNIFLKPYQTILDHSVELNYSESYLRKQITPIKDFLREHDTDITLSAKNGEYSLEAKNELKLIMLMSDFVKVVGFEDKLPSIFINHIDQLIEHLRIEADIHMTEPWRNEIFLIYRILHLRRKQGFEIPNIEDVLHKTYFHIIENKDFILNKTKQFLLENNLEIIDSELTLIYGFFIMISLKASYLPRPVSRFICRYQYFFDNFKQKDPTFSENFIELIEAFEKKLGLKYTHYTNELFFNLYNNTRIRTPRHLKIACYSDLGREHEHTLVRFMERHFPNHNSEPYLVSRNYDLIVTTSATAPSAINHTKYISISDFPDHIDFQNIFQIIFYENYDTKKLPDEK